MEKHVVITKEKLPNFKKIAQKSGVKVRDKEIYFIDIKYIEPDKFDPKVWSRNWMFAFDILTNGSHFDELYVLVVDTVKDIEGLYDEQIKLLRNQCIFLV